MKGGEGEVCVLITNRGNSCTEYGQNMEGCVCVAVNTFVAIFRIAAPKPFSLFPTAWYFSFAVVAKSPRLIAFTRFKAALCICHWLLPSILLPCFWFVFVDFLTYLAFVVPCSICCSNSS